MIKFLWRKSPDILYQLYKKKNKIRNELFYFSSRNNECGIKGTISINHPDYEKFKFSEHRSIIKGDYIVFLDTFFPYHPDLKKFFNVNLEYCGNRYNKSLIRFFDFIEEKYKMPVVIAAHPKSNYKSGDFGKREIIRYQTDNLVINSSAVLTHGSNSISYAILADKPMALICTDDYEKVYRLKRITKLLGRYFKIPYYNIDKLNFNDFDFSNVDKNVRNDYIYSYLTTQETKNKKTKEIIKETITKVR